MSDLNPIALPMIVQSNHWIGTAKSWRLSSQFLAILLAMVSAAQTAETTIVIKNCSLFDSAAEQMIPNRSVLIRGNQIERVCDPADIKDLPADAIQIDGKSKFLLPGLIDAHVHVVHVLDYAHVTGDEVLPLYLAAGVTSVRSTGDELVAARLVARSAEAHPESSPRVFTCSPLLDGDPPIHRGAGLAVTDPAKIATLFDELVGWDVRTIKIYAGTPRPVGRAIVDEGKRRGLFVTAHLGRYSAQDAVADGVDGLEHIWSVFNYVIPSEITSEPGHRGKVDFSNPICQALISELARQKTYVDPTLVVFRNMLLLPDEPYVRDHADNELAPKRLRNFWPVYLKRAGCPQGGPLEDRRRELAKYLELTALLHRAGVPLMVGTDAPEPQCTPGFSLHQELEPYVESGISPAATLRAATLNNAIVLGEKDRLGSIEAGKLADLILLTANPLERIQNTRQIELVIRGGKISRPAELLTRVPRE